MFVEKLHTYAPNWTHGYTLAGRLY